MTVKPHAFVAMPFGTKPGPGGEQIDFNRVYAELIAPALNRAGLTAFRADEETRAGDIRVDMFQELLIADLVVVDITVDNPNVWYELGVRHALRARGVVLISGGQASKAFDIYTDRKLRYQLRDGGPAPESLGDDVHRLCGMIVDTMESWHGRKISPVYQLMPNLKEPDWQSLRVGNLREFWEAYEDWERRIVHARRQEQVGDMLVLAGEAPIAAFRANAWIRAGKALRRVGHFDFALEQLELGLAVKPDDIDGQREKGICLQRLANAGAQGYSADMARDHYRVLLQRYPADSETWSLLGRVEKDAWIESWRRPNSSPEQRLADARYEDALLRAAIDGYAQAFRADPKHYYPGINAVALMTLYEYLNDEDRYREILPVMAGAVRFAAECEAEHEEDCYWARVTIGDLEVLNGSVVSAERAYKSAVAVNRNNRFALESSLSQLQIVQELGFAPDRVSAGIAVFERALARLPSAEDDWRPRRVLLFSGHMIDAHDRAQARFPEHKVEAASARIRQLLQELDAGPDDLALTQGACGGDLLFTESCLQRGVAIGWMQPFEEPDFIARSVARCGEEWRRRYLHARGQLTRPLRAAPTELGKPPASCGPAYAYERCNLWLLYTALAWGTDKVDFICLWNGDAGDGTGGTAHMYESVARRTGRVHWIDTRTL